MPYGLRWQVGTFADNSQVVYPAPMTTTKALQTFQVHQNLLSGTGNVYSSSESYGKCFVYDNILRLNDGRWIQTVTHYIQKTVIRIGLH